MRLIQPIPLVLLMLSVILWIPPVGLAAQQPQAMQEQSTAPPHALPAGKKLILKDGTYHLVRSYELRGDRVRYYSVERSEWEELPAELVDWQATEKAEAEEKLRREEALGKIRDLEKRQLAAEIDVDSSIEVAPGMFLPEADGLYVLDGSVLTLLSQSRAEAKLDKGRLLTQILVPVPVVPGRHKVQVPGKKAALRIRSTAPEFFMRTADAREPQMELVRAKVKGGVRHLESISTYITGEQAEQRDTVPLQSWQLAKGVFRFTVGQTLEPGEYALVEVLPDTGMNLYVWDFGIDGPGRNPAKKK